MKKSIFLCLAVLFIWTGWSAQAFAQEINLYSAQGDRLGLQRAKVVADYIRSKEIYINKVGTSDRVVAGTVLMEDANNANTSDHVDISDQLALGRRTICDPQKSRIDSFMQSSKTFSRYSRSETIIVETPPPPSTSTTIIVEVPPPPPTRQTIVLASNYYPYSYGYTYPYYNYGYYSYGQSYRYYSNRYWGDNYRYYGGGHHRGYYGHSGHQNYRHQPRYFHPHNNGPPHPHNGSRGPRRH